VGHLKPAHAGRTDHDSERDKSEAAAGQATIPGLAPDDVEPEKVKLFRARLTSRDYAIVNRAVVLELARQVCEGPDDDETAGKALVAISRFYLRAMAEGRSEGG
jgi:hypothetical protein